jgi:hypothetical protein
MAEDLDAQIECRAAELAPFLSRMETLREAFIEETVRFASEWFRKTVKEYVVGYPQVLLSLKEQEVMQMKAQVNELVKDTQRIVKTEFTNPKLWWHLKLHLNESTKLYLQIGDKPPEILDRAVRHVLGRLGLILGEYKFNVSATGESFSYKEFWFDRPLEKGSVATPSYPHMLNWSREMQQIIQEYNLQFVKAVDVYAQLQELEQEKKKQQAMSRWDSI